MFISKAVMRSDAALAGNAWYESAFLDTPPCLKTRRKNMHINYYVSEGKRSLVKSGMFVQTLMHHDD